ncbi:MAG: molecular chaperone [Bacteroidetes bacterium]|nr:molecular chaperone [Bacteroidota bacterium]
MQSKGNLRSSIRITKKPFHCYILVYLSLISLISINKADAQGDLLIIPKRVVFEGSKKSMELNLANIGRDTARFVVSLTQLRMKEDGTFETITEPDSGQYFADPYLRYFPRMVSLAPNEAQVVKLQVSRASQMHPGEYRSHLYFRAIPDETPLGDKKSDKEVKKDTTGISIQLKVMFGITIPVIIRVGDLSASVTLSDLSITSTNDTVPQLMMVFNRTGNKSVYGDIEVKYTGLDDKTIQVAIAKGVAVYTPNLRRQFHVNLRNIPGVDYHKGKLDVIFSSSSDVKFEKLAEAELLLQ